MGVIRFLLCIFISFLPAFLLSCINCDTKIWYSNLLKPDLSPPSWVFGVVWSILYLFIALSLFFFSLAKEAGHNKKIGYGFFAVQLLLNALYMPITLVMGSLFGGFLISVFLAVFIIFTMVEFAKVSAFSAYLLLPYLLWVFFAIFLSYQVYVLNS